MSDTEHLSALHVAGRYLNPSAVTVETVDVSPMTQVDTNLGSDEVAEIEQIIADAYVQWSTTLPTAQSSREDAQMSETIPATFDPGILPKWARNDKPTREFCRDDVGFRCDVLRAQFGLEIKRLKQAAWARYYGSNQLDWPEGGPV